MISDLHQIPLRENDLAIIYLDNCEITFCGTKAELTKRKREAHGAMRPFAVLRWSDCKGRMIWKVVEQHYMAKL